MSGHDDFSRIRKKTHGCKCHRGGSLYKEAKAELTEFKLFSSDIQVKNQNSLVLQYFRVTDMYQWSIQFNQINQ